MTIIVLKTWNINSRSTGKTLQKLAIQKDLKIPGHLHTLRHDSLSVTLPSGNAHGKGCHMSVSHIRATIILEQPSMRWTFSLVLVLHKYMYRLLILSMILYWVLWYKIIIIMILMLAVALVCIKLCHIIYTCACDICLAHTLFIHEMGSTLHYSFTAIFGWWKYGRGDNDLTQYYNQWVKR